MITTYYLLNKVTIVNNNEVESQLKKQLIYSTILLIPALYIVSKIALPSKFILMIGDHAQDNTYFDAFKCSFYGLISGLIIGYVT
jgi:Na+/H+-translocating membrane pyrophosphatase